MFSILLLFSCIIFGVLARVFKILPKQTPKVLNQFLIWFSLPAMAFLYLPKIHISSQLIYPIGVAWIGFLGSFILFNLLGNIFKWSKKLIGCLVLTAGLGNTSFIGIPVVEALYGEEGLQTLILVDQPGTFLVLSTVGVVSAGYYSRGKTNFKGILAKILSFPPFWGFVIGFSFAIFQWNFPHFIDEIWKKLALTVSPLALISVGYQLKFQRNNQHWKFLWLGLTYQLIIWPLIIYLLYIQIFKLSGTMVQVCVMESAMAPMITASIIASMHGLKPSLSQLMVAVGIPVSAITLAVWYLILR